MKAVNLEESATLTAEAPTHADTAWTRLPAFLTCSMAAPPFDISRSKMLMARSIASIVSESSFSKAAKTADSFVRIDVAASRSDWSFASSSPKSWIHSVSEALLAVSLAIVALSSFASILPVLISKPKVRERSSHHSANSS